MKISKTTAVCSSLAIFLLGANPLFAQEAAPAWLDLFDGQTLNGWQQLNGTARYEVRDGMIVGSTAAGSPNSSLCTTKDYGDYHLMGGAEAIDAGTTAGISKDPNVRRVLPMTWVPTRPLPTDKTKPVVIIGQKSEPGSIHFFSRDQKRYLMSCPPNRIR